MSCSWVSLALMVCLREFPQVALATLGRPVLAVLRASTAKCDKRGQLVSGAWIQILEQVCERTGFSQEAVA